MNYTAPGQHFKIPMLNLWMSWAILCPNLSFTVENKMENSHKRGWSHFKLKINDWDIPFPKILRIYQWIGKNIFHWGKWNEPIKLIRKCVRLKIKIKILVAAKDFGLGSFKTYVHLKLLIFDLLPSPLVHLCPFYIQHAHEFLNEKLKSEERENNYFFVNSR